MNSIYYYFYSGYKLIFAYNDDQTKEMTYLETENDTATKKGQNKSLLKMILILIITLVMCFISAFEITPENTTKTPKNEQIHMKNAQNEWMLHRELQYNCSLPQSESRFLNSKKILSASLPKSQSSITKSSISPITESSISPITKSSISPITKSSITKTRRINAIKPFNMIKKLVTLPITIIINMYTNFLNLFKR